MASVMKTFALESAELREVRRRGGFALPATREIESYWYPVWLSYPAGMLAGSRLLDAPPQHIPPAEVMEIAKDYEFVVLFTSTVGFL